MNPLLEIAFLLIGAILGYHFYIVDCLLYAFYLHPEDETSRHLREQIHQRRYWLALRMMLTMSASPKHYIHRSVKFVAAFVLMGVFVVTSTSGLFGRGFIAGFGVYVFFELLRLYPDPAILREKYFWDLSREVSLQNIRTLTNVTMLFMMLLTGFALM